MKDMIWRFPTWLLNGVWSVMHWQYLNTFFPTCIFECSNKDCLWVTGCPYIRWWPSLGAPAGVHHWWPHTVSHCTPHTAVWCPPCWRCALAQWPWCRWLQRARHPFPPELPCDATRWPSTFDQPPVDSPEKLTRVFPSKLLWWSVTGEPLCFFSPNNCKIQQKCAKRSLSLQVLSAYMKMTVKPLLQNYHLENLKNIPLSPFLHMYLPPCLTLFFLAFLLPPFFLFFSNYLFFLFSSSPSSFAAFDSLCGFLCLGS